jgi:putative membrane protein
MELSQLPALNAILNGTSAVLLTTGYFFIRRKSISAHRACMIAAFTTSTIFLISYLVYHYFHGSTQFQGEGWARIIYFTILISHTLLAAAIVPLAITTLYRALRANFAGHMRLARWTLPLWLYVSVTGVIIYLMLYRLYPPA